MIKYSDYIDMELKDTPENRKTMYAHWDEIKDKCRIVHGYWGKEDKILRIYRYD